MLKQFEGRKKIDAQTLLGFGIHYRADSLDASLTVHDATNERLKLVTPFIDSGTDVYNYKGREISLNLKYRF